MASSDLFALLSALFHALWMIAMGRHATRGGRPVATTIIGVASGRHAGAIARPVP